MVLLSDLQIRLNQNCISTVRSAQEAEHLVPRQHRDVFHPGSIASICNLVTLKLI